AVVTVSVKPGVVLVWMGVVLSVLGGLIAVLRRALDGRTLPNGHRVPLPRRVFGLRFGSK
ncbi:MAG TPA: hypothetical protein VFT99_04050, partial [Roseiflexaceae bacterium]|nr:hypothetical protein [Roseiflexaceae bacterium]